MIEEPEIYISTRIEELEVHTSVAKMCCYYKDRGSKSSRCIPLRCHANRSKWHHAEDTGEEASDGRRDIIQGHYPKALLDLFASVLTTSH